MLVNIILRNVAVSVCLSDDPEMLTCFESFSIKVRIETGAYSGLGFIQCLRLLSMGSHISQLLTQF